MRTRAGAARLPRRVDEFGAARRPGGVAQAETIDDLGPGQLLAYDGEHGVSALLAGDFASDHDPMVDAFDTHAQLVGPGVVRDRLLDPLVRVLVVLHAAVTLTGIS
jgi:hypothetical protein